ncbi:MAG TPA: molybdopterin-dependent oxidoreductase, partial [Chloroflexota bacterium]|nr:molybdopterin-dependent oxidoreductase [Chloroflexota bacterium]
MVAALVFSQALSFWLGWMSPLEGVAERVMQWTPLNIATFLLLNLQGEARVAALLGGAAVMLLLAGLAGGFTWRLPGHLAAPLAAVLVGVPTFVLFQPYDWRPVVLLLAGYGLGLALSDRGWIASKPKRSSSSASTLSRFEALFDTGIVLAGMGLLIGIGFGLPGLLAPAGRRLFSFRDPALPDFSYPGMPTPVTPLDSFYVNSKDLLPPSPRGWNLTIEGLVRRPLRFDLDTLRRLPRDDRYVTLECIDNPVGGPLIGNALWTGVELRRLLHLAGVTNEGRAVMLTGLDGYVESLSLAAAGSPDVLVAYGMNGWELTPDHGYPIRLLVPGVYGLKSVKWLSRITVASTEEMGMWQQRGWSQPAVVQTTTRIDVHRIVAGGVWLGGIAFAGNRGVSGVQVRVNGGKWRPARMSPTLSSPAAWRLWEIQVPV